MIPQALPKSTRVGAPFTLMTRLSLLSWLKLKTAGLESSSQMATKRLPAGTGFAGMRFVINSASCLIVIMIDRVSKGEVENGWVD